MSETTLDAGDVTLFVRTVGPRTAKTTIVALHGGPGITHEYMRNFEVLASADVRVVTYDQRGHGGSSFPKSGELSFEHQARDLEALREALGSATKLDIVSHSYGGPTAMAYATMFSKHVRSLIFVDSMPPKYGDYMAGQWYISEAISAKQRDGHIVGPEPPGTGDDCSPRLIWVLPVYFYDSAHPMTKHLAGSKCQDEIGDKTRAANQHYNFHDALGLVIAPTLVVHGEGDPFRKQMADGILAAMELAKPQFVLLEKCGHVPFEECPDRFYPIVREFLAKRP